MSWPPPAGMLAAGFGGLALVALRRRRVMRATGSLGSIDAGHLAPVGPDPRRGDGGDGRLGGGRHRSSRRFAEPGNGAIVRRSRGLRRRATARRKHERGDRSMPRSVPVRLRIPGIGVDSGADGSRARARRHSGEHLRVLFRPAGSPGRPTPSKVGPAIIVGHVRYKTPGVFARLTELRRGAMIMVHRTDGTDGEVPGDQAGALRQVRLGDNPGLRQYRPRRAAPDHLWGAECEDQRVRRERRGVRGAACAPRP